MKDLKTENKKQISIVLETHEFFDELEFMSAIRGFVEKFESIKIVGTHIKILKPIEKRGNEKNIQNNNRY